MRTAHLFAGAGGGLLADLILGHQSVLAVEIDSSCCRSMQLRIDEGWLPANLHIHCGDVRKFDLSPWSGKVDCIAAGFPCQDISCAGKGEGIKGARSGLVSEVFRAIDTLRPGVVFLENSPDIRTKGRRYIIETLVEKGYSWRDGTLTASAVGAGHARDRWWLLAADADGHLKLEQERKRRKKWGWPDHQARETANAHRQHGNLAGHAGCAHVGNGAKETTYLMRGKCKTERRQPLAGSKKRHDPPQCNQTAAHPLLDRQKRIGGGEVDETGQKEVALCPETYAADNMRQRLQIAVQRGGLSQATAQTIQAAARYTGTYHWSPPNAGICGMVDGLAAPLVGRTKGSRIKACGNGQVPLAVAAAWLILSGE